VKVIDHCKTWFPGLGAKMKAAGITHVGRYQGIGGSWKHLTLAEAKDYKANGIDIFTIMEAGTSRVKDGFEAGIADAILTRKAMLSCGAPVGAFVWACCDYEAPLSDCPAIIQYLKGAETVFGKGRVGLYGGRVACQQAQEAGFRIWQTHAWSGSPTTYWIPGSDMYQRNDWGYTYYGTSFLDNYDTNEIKKADFGQWGAVAPVVVTPPPVVVTPPIVEVPMANPTVDQVLAAAQKDVGMHDSPSGSDKNPITKWFGAVGAYCAMSVCHWFREAGWTKFPLNAGAHELLIQLRDQFHWPSYPGSRGQKGDVVQFTWSHTGMIKRRIDTNHVLTIEGNSEDSGVHEKTRHNNEISFVVRPPYGVPVVQTTPVVVVPPAPTGTWRQAVLIKDAQGHNGPPTFGTHRDMLRKGGTVYATGKTAKNEDGDRMDEVSCGGKTSWIRYDYMRWV
jgi:hypothetical protein